MAAEIVELSAEFRERVLVTQSIFKPDTSRKLRNCISRGQWDANPPVILTPMPSSYRGRYDFHLYNGNHRDHHSREWGVPLNGLIAQTIDDIPKQELPNRNTGLTPDYMLSLGLINLFNVVYGAETGGKLLVELVDELQELEQILTHEELVAYIR